MGFCIWNRNIDNNTFDDKKKFKVQFRPFQLLSDDYFKEMYLSDIEKKWNLDLSAMSGNNTSTKRFDFVVKTANTIYLIETNFYTAGGSKLNEVARSYSDIAPKINSVPGFEFVWITDGIGWKSARNKLQEAYNIIPRIYNLTDIDSFIELL